MITGAANRWGISKEFRAVKICRTFEKILPDIFKDLSEEQSAALKEAVQARFYKKNTLFVSVSGSAWASEIMMRKHKILGKLKEEFPLIRELKTIGMRDDSAYGKRAYDSSTYGAKTAYGSDSSASRSNISDDEY